MTSLTRFVRFCLGKGQLTRCHRPALHVLRSTVVEVVSFSEARKSIVVTSSARRGIGAICSRRTGRGKLSLRKQLIDIEVPRGSWCRQLLMLLLRPPLTMWVVTDPKDACAKDGCQRPTQIRPMGRIAEVHFIGCEAPSHFVSQSRRQIKPPTPGTPSPRRERE